MLLAVDIGNTHTVLGVFEGRKLLHSWRVKSDRDKTSDEFGILFRQLIRASGIDVAAVTDCVVCSVVPPLLASIRAGLATYLNAEPLVVEPGVRTGVSLRVDNPREVGADRIVNAVAAWEKVHGGAIVVDFGTATTFDCVSPVGEYLGGVICPGVVISAEALAVRTAKLPRIELSFPKTVCGKNSVHAIQAGLTYGYVDLTDGIVTRLRNELEFPVKVTATGGLAKLIAPYSRTIEEVDETLTLEGLRIIHERNRA